MKIEHFALNVKEPLAMSDWYEKNLGLRAVKKSKEAPYMIFLADSSGRVMIEIYKNPPDQVPDYKNMDPLIMHIAFVSDDPVKDKDRLLQEGATLVSDEQLDDGSHLVMLRDPWGVPLQLCKRSSPMLDKVKNFKRNQRIKGISSGWEQFFIKTNSMKRTGFLLIVSGLTYFFIAATSFDTAVSSKEKWYKVHEPEAVIGTIGGLHILAEPGKLIIEIEKRDLNHTDVERELRAIFTGPDRRVIREKRIPDDGQSQGSGMGPPQKVTFQTDVERKGVYSINITVSGGQNEPDIIWGFRTNSKHYLIESARGHRDADHEEPIVLRNPEAGTDVWFMPPERAFGIEITDLPETMDQLILYDSKGGEVQTLEAENREVQSVVLDDSRRENVPWYISFPKALATIQIDGVTRWPENNDSIEDLNFWAPRTEDDDLYEDLSFWSNNGNSWFPLRKYRWILTPYNRKVYGNPGEAGAYTFEVHNNSPELRTMELKTEFPGNDFEVELIPDRLTLESRESAPVTVRYTVPDEKKSVHLRVTPSEEPDFSTYSTLQVRAGEPAAKQPLDLPLVITPYQHENYKLGYVPDYPVDWEMYHDLENRPVVRVDGGLMRLNDGNWQKKEFEKIIQSDDPSFDRGSVEMSRSNTKVAFDGDNDLYMIATLEGRAALLHSVDYGENITAYDLGDSGNFDIENFSGHNTPEGPPAILRSVMTYHDEERIWRRISDLELIITEKKNNELIVNDPILISDVSLGVSTHSGLASAIVSRGDKVHIIWGEATDPEEDVPGVPTYVASYNRSTGQLEGEPVLIGYGPPPNNVHNSPSITIDSKGYLHAIIGTHGQPFLYTRSLEANNVHGGWAEPEMLTEQAARQTYVGLVCGMDDTLHLVYRLWRYGEEPHPKAQHAALAYQQKPPGEPWSEPRLLFLPPFSEYSIFYHRLGIDRKGHLMLSYDYWSTYWFYRNDHRDRAGHYRKTMRSEDGGKSWKLFHTEDL
jgi:catechol 2,3-dioxygenase-like lactoylglutathione lyase family enzyme